MSEDQPLAGDKLANINAWVAERQEALDDESISYGELSEIDLVHDIIKGTLND